MLKQISYANAASAGLLANPSPRMSELNCIHSIKASIRARLETKHHLASKLKNLRPVTVTFKADGNLDAFCGSEGHPMSCNQGSS